MIRQSDVLETLEHFVSIPQWRERLAILEQLDDTTPAAGHNSMNEP